MEARRHEIVSRTFRRALDYHRRIDLDELAIIEKVAHRLDDVVAHPDVTLHTRATQIEIAVLKSQILVDVGVDVDLKGRDLRAVEHVEFVDADLDRAGG